MFIYNTEQCVEQQNQKHIVAAQRQLLHHIVEAQTQRRAYCKNYPHDIPIREYSERFLFAFGLQS